MRVSVIVDIFRLFMFFTVTSMYIPCITWSRYLMFTNQSFNQMVTRMTDHPMTGPYSAQP
ncbi:hypothetical protein AHAS_Ahas11G0235600 [Arachis hypogaea]